MPFPARGVICGKNQIKSSNYFVFPERNVPQKNRVFLVKLEKKIFPYHLDLEEYGIICSQMNYKKNFLMIDI